MRSLIYVGSVVLISLVARFAYAQEEENSALWQEVNLMDGAICKAIPNEQEPLRKKLSEFEKSQALRDAAVEMLRQHVHKDGIKKVMDERLAATTKEKLQQLNEKLRGGAKPSQIDFPVSLLWGVQPKP